MTIGKVARKVLGKRFDTVGRMYRRFFLDVDAFVSELPEFKDGAIVADIGGGDGEIIEKILSAYPKLSVRMIDPSPQIGRMISEKNRSRVELYAGHTMSTYREREEYAPVDYVIVSDVLHHIPSQDRETFFDELVGLCDERSCLIIKDIQPGHIKSFLSLFSDKVISGDKNTALIDRDRVVGCIKKRFSAVDVQETKLHQINAPNYCLVFTGFKR